MPIKDDMTNSELIAVISICATASTAILIAMFNYLLNVKAKRLDLIYANKITGFKEVSRTVAKFRNYCLAKMALSIGHEDYHHYDENINAFEIRNEISTSVVDNSIFFSALSRQALDRLLISMRRLIQFEQTEFTDPASNDDVRHTIYGNLFTESDSMLDLLYREVGLR